MKWWQQFPPSFTSPSPHTPNIAELIALLEHLEKKREKKDKKAEEAKKASEAAKKKEPEKPKPPMFSVIQVTVLMMAAGPFVGLAYLYAATALGTALKHALIP